jgi:hypothetical protein
MYNVKSRYIRHRHNIIKYLLSNEIISINLVKSKENIVGPLTKDLLRELMYNSLKGMGLKLLKDERV